jgi:beta-N-acetylhexosaminidase
MQKHVTRRVLLRTGLRGASAALLAAAVAPAARGGARLLLAAEPDLDSELRSLLNTGMHSDQPAEDVPLDIKLGQMIMLGFRGRYLVQDSMILRAIREQHIGAVVMFRPNIQSPAQVSALTTMLQAASKIPLLVAVDHEGGKVNRFTGNFGFSSNHSAQALGAQNDLALTQAQSANAAQRMAAFGISLNLAPVVDLNLNPQNPAIGRYERSYSADPTVVVAHARAVIESHHAHGVLCTLKHFPGHGSSHADSHFGFVDVSNFWQEGELAPYAELIKGNLCDAVMTAHIFNAKLDLTYPATLSRAVITGILREKLGYDGVVISDDIQMHAIAAQYDYATAIRLVVEAGVDIIAISNMIKYAEDWAPRTVGILRGLVDSGAISPARIDQSYQRILRLKQRIAPAPSAPPA